MDSILSKHSLVAVVSQRRFSPGQFLQALGAPSFTGLLRSIQPMALWAFRALLRLKVCAHLPRISRRMAAEAGRAWRAGRCWEIRSCTFTYRSRSVDGRDITLSGRVTFLHHQADNLPHQARSVSLHMHQAFFSEEWAPSNNLMFAPLKVLWDSVVIEPDLQKWGINYGIEYDGGGSAVHMARQLADCTVAAFEIMQQHGVSLAPDGYTTNWGSSQNAVPTLLFAKWYDTQAPQWFRQALRLRSTFVAEGAAEMTDLMRAIYRDTTNIDTNFILLVAYFKAFSPDQLGGYRPEEFVPQWFIDTTFSINGRNVPFLDAVSHHYPQLTDPYLRQIHSFDQVFAPDMLTPDGQVDCDSPKIKAWLDCLARHNDMTAWTPAHSLYIAHGPADDMIPYETAYNLYRTLSDHGRNPLVHMLAVPSMSFLPSGGLRPHFIIAFIGQILMAFAQNPEDMQRFYKLVK